MLKDMMNSFATLFSQREILLNLVGKNLKAKYAGSFFGILWAFINPLLLALIVGFVFTHILKTNIENFYLFVVSGMLPWSFFSGSLQEAAVSIPSHSNILKQFALPKEFIPISAVLANFILFLFGIAIVMPFFMVVNPQAIFMVPLLLIACALLFLFTLGISLIVAALCVDFRDINQALNTILMLWLWLTPVFYSVDTIPEEYGYIFNLNPMTPFIGLFRQALLKKGIGNAEHLLFALALSFVVVGAGFFVFYKREGGFLKRI